MNPHKLSPGFSFYTWDKEQAERVSKKYPGTYVDTYSLGDDRPRSALPFAVWTKNKGAMLLYWARESVT